MDEDADAADEDVEEAVDELIVADASADSGEAVEGVEEEAGESSDAWADEDADAVDEDVEDAAVKSVEVEDSRDEADGGSFRSIDVLTGCRAAAALS